MKKLLIPVIACAITLSCGTADDAAGMSKSAISQADKAIEMEKSPLLGELPSIAARCNAATDSLRKISRKLTEKRLNGGGKMDNEEIKQFSAEVDQAKTVIKEHYQKEFDKKSGEYTGLKLHTGWDENVFSGATAEITGFKGCTEAEVTYTLTTSAPVGRFIRVLFVTEQNQLVMPYSLMCSPCGAGTTFSGKTMVPLQALSKTGRLLFSL